MLNSPVAQGLLAGGLGAMASRGSTMQALGRGGLLGLSAMGQAQASQENRLVQQAKLQLAQDKANREQQQFEQKQKAIKSLVPDANGAINATPAALMAAELGPEHWAAVLNFGRNKVKEYQDVRMPDGSVQRVGFTEYGDTVNTGATPFSELKVVDFGGNQAAFDPIAGNVRDLGRKTATIAELEAQRHNRASEGLTLRSQNLTDARAREKNQIDQGAVSKVEWKQGVNGEWIALPKEVSGDGPVTPIMTTVPGKRESQAAGALGIIGEAEKLIDKATGSYLGAAVDTGARAFGLSPASAQAAAQLQALEGALMMAQPRMEGPQSDKDVALYKQMAGQIGDATVPAEQKKAALEVVKKLHQRYAGASTQQPQAPNERSVVRTGIFNGRKVVQYSDGSTAYAD